MVVFLGFDNPHVFLLLVALALYIVAALASLAARSFKAGSRICFSLSALASLLALTAAVYGLLLQKEPIVWTGPELPGLPGASLASVRLDPLSWLFIALISLVSFYVSIFSPSYVEVYEHEYSFAPLGFFYPLFILSMLMVVLADDALSFYLFWELMTIASWALIAYEFLSKESRDAAKAYLVLMHICAACLIPAFVILYNATGSMSFEKFRTASSFFVAQPALATLVFLLTLVAFGSKAGLIPLHAWLPRAHPAAPSNVSALLSGVMLKVAAYGFIRVVFEFLKPTGYIGLGWGIITLALASVTTLLGVAFAVPRHDIKELLAYSSIENMGIVFLGIGTAIILQSVGEIALAALALLAALYHSLNHAVVKSLLFLCSGSIIRSYGTRNIEKLGGVATYLPWTALTFLVGAIAISGLPPLHCFASEWLTYQSLLSSARVAPPWVSFAAFLSALALGTAGALAVFCFTKAFGAIFLGPPAVPRPARGETGAVKVGLAIPALLCFLLGVGMPLATQLIGPSSSYVIGSAVPVLATPLSVGVAGAMSSSLLPPVYALALIVLPLVIGSVAGISALKVTRTSPWVCGVAYNPRVMRPTASAYAGPVRELFSRVYGLRVKKERIYSIEPAYTGEVVYEYELDPAIERYIRVRVEGPPASPSGRLFRAGRVVEEVFYKPFAKPIVGVLEAGAPGYKEAIAYAPLAKPALMLGELVKKLQSGKLYLYMLYIIITFIVLIIIGVVWP